MKLSIFGIVSVLFFLASVACGSDITYQFNDLEQQLQDLDTPEHRATMRDRLATLIEQFESQHPAITGMLDQVMTTLAGMGV